LKYSHIISVVGNYEQTTDNIIPRDSCHPQEHLLAAKRYLSKRMEHTTSVKQTKKSKATQ
jgi:hypothetical protein